MSNNKSTQLVKSVVYGNTATKLEREIPSPHGGGQNHTHRWTFFIKPYHREDLSSFVRKVEFKLDRSFKNPVRVVGEAPYEVTETGWGEFDLHFKVYFRCSKARPVTYWHRINLFPSKV